MINFIVNQSISCAKHVALIHYKVGQSLIQTGERITTCANLVTKWGKNNYKVGQLRIITKGQKILKSRAVNPLQNEVIIITQRACITEKAALLQSGPNITNWGKSFHKVHQVIITKWVNHYCKVR